MTQLEEFERDIRQAGLRMTRQRRVILDVLVLNHDHPDALEIYRRARKIDNTVSLSTVYRTMTALEKQGSIHRHAFEGGPSRYEQAKGEHHDHLIDVDTGDIIEFRSDLIEKLQDEIAGSLGYDVVHHRLELYGKKRK